MASPATCPDQQGRTRWEEHARISPPPYPSARGGLLNGKPGSCAGLSVSTMDSACPLTLSQHSRVTLAACRVCHQSRKGHQSCEPFLLLRFLPRPSPLGVASIIPSRAPSSICRKRGPLSKSPCTKLSFTRPRFPRAQRPPASEPRTGRESESMRRRARPLSRAFSFRTDQALVSRYEPQIGTTSASVWTMRPESNGGSRNVHAVRLAGGRQTACRAHPL